MWRSKVHRFLYAIFAFSLSAVLFAQSWPIDEGQGSAPLTSPFGPRRYPNPVRYDFHYGTDIRTSASTTI